MGGAHAQRENRHANAKSATLKKLTHAHMRRTVGRTLMIKVAELVLKNPGRKEQMKAKEAAAKAEAGGSSSGAGGSKPAPSKKGKKGKK